MSVRGDFLGIFFFLAFCAGAAGAHSGRTDGKGCHHDRKYGTGYHCHNGAKSAPAQEYKSQKSTVSPESSTSASPIRRRTSETSVKQSNPFLVQEKSFKRPNGFYAIGETCALAEYFLLITNDTWEFPTGTYVVAEERTDTAGTLSLTKESSGEVIRAPLKILTPTRFQLGPSSYEFCPDMQAPDAN